ncbi:MAG TPA: CopD family protein [Chitinophagaceae bacterium]|nr:CopD family protein [Chitinophagaceae bacterium]
MELQYLKAVHIIFVVTWFAGLFYLPRLMVYTAEANALENRDTKAALLAQYRLMQRRLLYGITWPSAIITAVLGARLLMIYPLTGWLKLKLVFVILLYLYHFSLQVLYNQQRQNVFRYSGQQLRFWNEVPTVILFAVVFLAVMKNTDDVWWGLAGLAGLVLLLVAGIRGYRYWRTKK